MELLEVLKIAIGHIRSGALTSEAKVKLAVILPILRALGWNDSDPAEVAPEFDLPDGKVDYALIRKSDNTPLVFIEAKRLGLADEKGEKQLFDYATNRGIPLLVLTDGDVWDFYLSMAEGVRSERRFYHAELQREENISNYARHFVDYLQKDRVISGQARQKAEERRLSEKEKNKARKIIPSVWREMLSEPDDMLRDLLVEAVEGKCGTKPEFEDVGEFLAKQIPSHSGAPSVAPPASRSPYPTPQTRVDRVRRPQPDNFSEKKTALIGFVLFGKERVCKNAAQTLAEVLKEFHRRNPDEFMEGYDSKYSGTKKRLVARSREGLYKDPWQRSVSINLENGWWLGPKLSKDQIKQQIEIACEVAGVKFGSELTLIEG